MTHTTRLTRPQDDGPDLVILVRYEIEPHRRASLDGPEEGGVDVLSAVLATGEPVELTEEEVDGIGRDHAADVRFRESA